MPVRGTPKFDTVALLQASMSFIDGAVALRGKAAYASSATGMTHGSTTCTRWSKETLELLAALRGSMEQDIAGRDFQDMARDEDAQEEPPAGIGEHLVGDAQPA